MSTSQTPIEIKQRWIGLSILSLSLSLFISLLLVMSVAAQETGQTHLTYLPLINNGVSSVSAAHVEPSQYHRSEISASSIGGEIQPPTQAPKLYVGGPTAVINVDIDLVTYITEQCGVAPPLPELKLFLLANSIQPLPHDETKEREDLKSVEVIAAYAVTTVEGGIPGDDFIPNDEIIAWIRYACQETPWPLWAEKDLNGFGIDATESAKGYTEGIILALGNDGIIAQKELVAYIAEECMLEEIPPFRLQLLHSPIRLWRSGDAETPPTTENEPKQSIGIYAVTAPEGVDNELPLVSVDVIIPWINRSCMAEHILTEPNYGFFQEKGWTYKDGPHTVGNAPGVQLGDFQHQWAFRRIDVLDKSNTHRSPYEGANIHIGIFDTSPFLRDGFQRIPTSTHTYQVNNSFLSDPFDEIEENDPPITDTNCSTPNEHGPLVASLAQEVAPQSDVSLYRVMNHCGEGTLAHLMPALAHFIDQVTLSGKHGIINMSLGAAKGKPVILQALLLSAKKKGIVNVAAAGNNSWIANLDPQGDPYTFTVNGKDVYTSYISDPVSQTWPALFDSVTGVAAIADNNQMERSCYSNSVDANFGIAAPGGGIEAIDVGACNAEYFIKEYCQAGGVWAKEHCLIGVDSQGQFKYLAGTSFAAPLVSGIAALIEGDHLALSQPRPPGLTPICRTNPQHDVYDNPSPTTDRLLGKGIARYIPPQCPTPPPN